MKKVRGKMAGKLVSCVLQCPELWDSRLLVYRDLNTKGQNWTETSQLLERLLLKLKIYAYILVVGLDFKKNQINYSLCN